MIRIIDTPGINDTRGQDQDELNFEQILSLIAHFGKLHAICTLLKPNEAKLSTAFRNCMDETLSSGWQHNVEECKKLLKRVQGMSAHDVEYAVDVNRTRSLLIAMACPLIEIAQNQLMNKKMVEDMIKEIINGKVQGELAECKDSKKHAEILLKDFQNQLENIDNEYHLIKESSMEFSAYLKYTSNATAGYSILWRGLRRMVTDYKFGVQHILDEIKNKRRTPLSSIELNRKILNLSHIKLSDSLIADIALIQGSMEEE